MRNFKYLMFGLFFLGQAFATTGILLESGAVWQLRNDVQIPRDSGTMVSFDEYNNGPFFHYRLEGHFQSRRGHGLRFIYAPLSLSVTGEESRIVNFDNVSFSANTPMTIDYVFNSYRVGYTYKLLGSDKNFFKIGITGKVRQASITFSQGDSKRTYDNIGFVPLAYYAFDVRISNEWSIFSDADFAFAPQGRALDIVLKFRRHFLESSSIGLGVRTLEGGADNDKVKTFTFAQYAVLDLLLAW